MSVRPRVLPIQWVDEISAYVRLLDQTLLPAEEVYLEIRTPESMWQAIRRLSVRGAPAIGIAAAYGVVLATLDKSGVPMPERAPAERKAMEAAEHLATARPTAVNLFAALHRMRDAMATSRAADGPALHRDLLAEARAIHDEDRGQCQAIGAHGATLIEANSGVLTHCNTGSLATGGIGTAIAALITAWRRDGKRFRVYACETRPLLQGARLTAWELMREGLDVTLITDSMAAAAMRQEKIQSVIVGADCVAANGDVANKIGTYSHAVLAAHHDVPFYVAAPLSTFDRACRSGEDIRIEEREPDELRTCAGQQVAPLDVDCWAPAFDVTPAHLIHGIVTEVGVLRPPYGESIADAFRAAQAAGRAESV